MRDERMVAIRTHIMALPERQRMAVLMHKYQGMDYRQIGDVLKLSESATNRSSSALTRRCATS